MSRRYDPIVADVNVEVRERVQAEFGRHLVEQRNRVASQVRKWIETDTKFPIPIYDRVVERVRKLDAKTRADVASICLLMADQIATGILATFAGGDEMQTDGRVVNYAIVAQFRQPGSDEVTGQVDVNRGEPVIPLWDRYKRWLNRFAPSALRPRSRADDGAMSA